MLENVILYFLREDRTWLIDVFDNDRIPEISFKGSFFGILEPRDYHARQLHLSRYPT
jgi:hypothetical protein